MGTFDLEGHLLSLILEAGQGDCSCGFIHSPGMPSCSWERIPSQPWVLAGFFFSPILTYTQIAVHTSMFTPPCSHLHDHTSMFTPSTGSCDFCPLLHVFDFPVWAILLRCEERGKPKAVFSLISMIRYCQLCSH